MTVALDRRGFVAASLAQAMAFALGGSAHGQAGAGHDGLVLGQAQPFSFDALKARAKDLAGVADRLCACHVVMHSTWEGGRT